MKYTDIALELNQMQVPLTLCVTGYSNISMTIAKYLYSTVKLLSWTAGIGGIIRDAIGDMVASGGLATDLPLEAELQALTRGIWYVHMQHEEKIFLKRPLNFEDT